MAIEDELKQDKPSGSRPHTGALHVIEESKNEDSRPASRPFTGKDPNPVEENFEGIIFSSEKKGIYGGIPRNPSHLKSDEEGMTDPELVYPPETFKRQLNF